MRCVRVLIALLLVAVACAPTTTESPSPPTDVPIVDTVPTTSPTDGVTTTTEARRPSPKRAPSTLVRGLAEDAPAVLVYGWDGISRVEGGVIERLVEDPVRWAVDDGAGGIVFETVTEIPGMAWLADDADTPHALDLGAPGTARVGLVFARDGEPQALLWRADEMSRCEPGEYINEVTVLDLASHDERFFTCADEGQDGGESWMSFGGDRFLTVGWLAVGPFDTNTVLRFYDMNGQVVDVAHNPFAEPCAPCHLSALLSPDGSRLAYALWPTSFWDRPLPEDGDYTTARRDFVASQQHVPTELVVVDLASGAETFRAEVEADARLTGFDGELLTVLVEDGRVVVDVGALELYEVRLASSGDRDFWTVILASLDNTTTSYDEAQARAARFADDIGGPTGVLWSDGFVSLNPGYWAVFTGRFDDRDAATAACEALEVSCYPRYVATARTFDLAITTDDIVLQSEGLGVVPFGTTQGEVLTLFERLLGSPPTGSYAEAGWVEYIGWEDHGLYLGFSREWYELWDGVARFIGWQYIVADVQLDLRTDLGVGIGTTLAELRSIYGDELVVHEGSICDSDLSESTVSIDGPPPITVLLHAEIGVVQAMFAGMQTGC